VKKSCRFACALALALSFGGAGHAQETGLQMEVLLKSGHTWDGAALPAYPDGPPEITIVKLTVPPGTELPIHRHPFINGGMLLSGELKVRSESGQETHIRAGDAVLELVDTWHAGRNEGTEPAVALVFYVGTPGVPLTERKPAAETE